MVTLCKQFPYFSPHTGFVDNYTEILYNIGVSMYTFLYTCVEESI